MDSIGKIVRLPATDIAGVLGFFVMVVASVAVAKKLPVVKKLV